jgi:hypothetical protein
LRRFRPRCVWIAGLRFGSFSELIVRQPPALYILDGHVFSALSADPDGRIVNPALELRSKLLSTAMGGDPAPTPFSTMRLPLDPTRELPSSSMPRFADLLDYARKGMAGGFSPGRMICAKKGCRSRPHASRPHTSFPPYPAVSGGKWCGVRSPANRTGDPRNGSGLRFYAQGLANSEPLQTVLTDLTPLRRRPSARSPYAKFAFLGADSGK